MADGSLNLRTVVRCARQHSVVVAVVVLLGLLAGAGYGICTVPMKTGTALVVLPTSVHNAPTQVVIATSQPVLTRAIGDSRLAVPLRTLERRVKAGALTANIVSIRAEGTTAANAEQAANAVAVSYVAYFEAATRPARAQILERATSAAGTPLAVYALGNGVLGLLGGLLLSAIIAVVISRRDRRLRDRDAIAGAAGAPVLASVNVRHPGHPRGWARLLERHQPGAIETWRLGSALDHLELVSVAPASITVLSLGSDRRAQALGPQLAICAAELGIRTELVLDTRQGVEPTKTLRAACIGLASEALRSGRLRVSVRRDTSAQDGPELGLTVVVSVLDGQSSAAAAPAPLGPRTMRTVAAVTAGAVTAEQFARLAGRAQAGWDLDGVLVADPDRSDCTTGRLSQLVQPRRRQMATRVQSERVESERVEAPGHEELPR